MEATMAAPTRSAVSRYLEKTAALVDRELDRIMPKASEAPARLHKAMRYAVFGGGKRIRPAVAIAVCEAAGGRAADALPAACALELIHTYSLVHDDLPAMDDDDFRRGRPSCHKAFDEATAILVGDGLQALAFEILGSAELVRELARACGSRGMVGGQAFDLASSSRVTGRRLEEIHLLKTAAMITGAARMGALAAGAPEESIRRLTAYGRNLGLAFQIVDDILDVCGTAQELGKTPGKDAEQDKATYPALYGLEASRKRAAKLIQAAREAVSFLHDRGRRLTEIAEYILARTH